LNVEPNIEFCGIGGSFMHQAGAQLMLDCNRISVIGVSEVIKILPLIVTTYWRINKRFRDNPPDLVILVDYPGFNLKIAKLAKRFKIPVLYYISPQIWAWRYSRIKTIKRYVDQMAVILPFEQKMYQQEGVNAAYVGNPSVNAIKPQLSPAQARQLLNIGHEAHIVALMAGSRNKEITRMLPIYLATANQLHNDRAKPIHFILPLAPGVKKKLIRSYTDQYPGLNIHITAHNRFDVLQLADAALVTSGTATLETALLGVPTAIAYRLSKPTYWLGRLLINSSFIGLCNLIAQKELAPEFIQKDANKDNLTKFIHEVLDNRQGYGQRLTQALTQFHRQLTDTDNIHELPELVLKTINITKR
jgi:lipid-A-disaccharide synthase